MSDPDLYLRNGAVRVKQDEARAIAKRLHERAASAKRHEPDVVEIWNAWMDALRVCGLDIRIVRRRDPE